MFKNKKVLLAYLSVCILWGSTYLAIKIGVKDFPPMFFGGTRFLVAGFIMFLYAKHKKMTFPSGKKDLINVSFVGILLLTSANGLVVFAEQFIDSSLVSLILAICPLLIMVLEVMILKTYKMPTQAVLGIFIGFSGVAYLILSSSNMGRIHPLGITLTLLAPFSWALGSVYSKRSPIKGDMIPIIAYQMLAGGAGQLLIGIFRNEFSDLSSITSGSIYAWLYLVIFGSIVGYSSYIYILEHLPVSVAGTYAYVNPVVAVILGALVLSEPITLPIIISTVIIITAVMLVTSSKKKRPQIASETSIEKIN